MKSIFSISQLLCHLGLVLLAQTNITYAQSPVTCLNQNLEEGNTVGKLDPPSLSIESVSTEKADFLLALAANWKHALTFCQALDSWTNLETAVNITLGSSGTFGGINATMQGNQLRFAIQTYEDEEDGLQEEVNFNKLAHAFTFAGGLQTDAEFQNVSILVEGGYAPVFLGLPWLKIGTSIGDTSWIRAGVFFQGGYTTSIVQAAESGSTQENGDIVDSSGALLRFRFGGSSDMLLPINTSDIKALHFLPEAWFWYDVLNNRVYGLFEGTITLDITENISYNLISFKQGSPPPDFTPGTQFSTGLIIHF